MEQGKGCNESSRRSGAEFFFRAELVEMCKIVVTGVGEVSEVLSPAMVVLQTDSGSVMCTSKGPIGEVGGSLFG